VDTLYTVRFREVSGLSSFEKFENHTTGCGDIAYSSLGYFILSHPVDGRRVIRVVRVWIVCRSPPTCICAVQFPRHLSAVLVSDADRPPRIYSEKAKNAT